MLRVPFSTLCGTFWVKFVKLSSLVVREPSTSAQAAAFSLSADMLMARSPRLLQHDQNTKLAISPFGRIKKVSFVDHVPKRLKLAGAGRSEGELSYLVTALFCSRPKDCKHARILNKSKS